jgi:hypothetical protein
MFFLSKVIDKHCKFRSEMNHFLDDLWHPDCSTWKASDDLLQKKKHADSCYGYDFFSGYKDYCEYQRDILGFLRILHTTQGREDLSEFWSRLTKTRSDVAAKERKENEAIDRMSLTEKIAKGLAPCAQPLSNGTDDEVDSADDAGAAKKRRGGDDDDDDDENIAAL